MMKAATGGQVQRVAYLYTMTSSTWKSSVLSTNTHMGGGVREIPVTDLNLLGIAGAVIDGVKGVSLE